MKKLAMRKVGKEDFSTILALIAITSDFIHHSEPMFLYLLLSISYIYISLLAHSLLQKFINSSIMSVNL